VKISFWLIPAEPSRGFYQTIVHDLAQRYDAPSFTPHVTLYSGEYSRDISIDDLIETAIQTIHPLSLKIDRVRYSQRFTKTLFVQFCPHPRLNQLSESLRSTSLSSQESSSDASNFVLDPHLSLIYGSLSDSEKQHLAETLDIPKSELWFDEIRAIATPTKTQTREDVERWNVLYTTKLR
jgi:2'-5' RNA ligase